MIVIAESRNTMANKKMAAPKKAIKKINPAKSIAPKTSTASKTATATRTATATKTSTDAYTQGNITVTGGAGAGETKVNISIPGLGAKKASKPSKAKGKK